MLSQLKELVRDPHLQQTLRSAASQADALRLLTSAAAQEGWQFTTEAVADTLMALSAGQPQALSEEELLAVSGGQKCCESGGMKGSALSTDKICTATTPWGRIC